MPSKLQTLVDESECGAVIDTGCSTTVCEKQWLQSYKESLSEYERTQISEQASTSSFTFGDGRTVHSQSRVTVSCWIGGLRAEITTDVVDSNVPLLLSRKSMKSTGMRLFFDKDVLEVGGKSIKLVTTASGHYVLPISL